MKIIDSVASWIVKRASTTVNPEKWFTEYFQGGAPTKSGVTVNNDTALQLSTYWACVRNISEDVAKLPLKTYRPLAPQGKECLYDHPMYKILHDAPNSEMTAMTFREVLTAHCLNWGNGYAYIDRGRFNEIKALWPLRPDKVKPYRNKSGSIVYEITDDNGQKSDFQAFDILHIPGLGYDGIVGYNVARYARECLGTITAAEQHGAYFFSNGSNANGILEIPSVMSEKARENLKTSFATAYSGIKNSGKTIVLEEGCKFNKTSIPPEEAQFLETRQYSIPEICRWFRMIPNKVADTTRAQGWSTLEQLNTDYVVDTLTPWFVRWEQELYRKCLSESEKAEGIYFRHLADALLRGDIAARNAAYTAGRNGGWLSVDDIREKEDMNPLPDGIGQIYLQPLNMVEAGTEPEPVKPPYTPEPTSSIPTEDDEDDTEAKTVNVNISVPQQAKIDDGEVQRKKAFADDCAERISNSEIREIEKHIYKKDSTIDFQSWLSDFYIKHERYCIRVLMPLVGLKDASVLAMTLIDDCQFDGDDFDTFKKEVATKHKEFLNAVV